MNMNVSELIDHPEPDFFPETPSQADIDKLNSACSKISKLSTSQGGKRTIVHTVNNMFSRRPMHGRLMGQGAFKGFTYDEIAIFKLFMQDYPKNLFGGLAKPGNITMTGPNSLRFSGAWGPRNPMFIIVQQKTTAMRNDC